MLCLGGPGSGRHKEPYKVEMTATISNDKDTPVHINPSTSQLQKLIENHDGDIRTLTTKQGNLYAWQGSLSDHGTMQRALGIDKNDVADRHDVNEYYDPNHPLTNAEAIAKDLKR